MVALKNALISAGLEDPKLPKEQADYSPLCTPTDEGSKLIALRRTVLSEIKMLKESFKDAAEKSNWVFIDTYYEYHGEPYGLSARYISPELAAEMDITVGLSADELDERWCRWYEQHSPTYKGDMDKEEFEMLIRNNVLFVDSMF